MRGTPRSFGTARPTRAPRSHPRATTKHVVFAHPSRPNVRQQLRSFTPRSHTTYSRRQVAGASQRLRKAPGPSTARRPALLRLSLTTAKRLGASDKVLSALFRAGLLSKPGLPLDSASVVAATKTFVSFGRRYEKALQGDALLHAILQHQHPARTANPTALRKGVAALLAPGAHGGAGTPEERQIASFFKAAGMNKVGIAGLIGNAYQESGVKWGTPGGGMWQQITNFGSGAPAPKVQMSKMLGQIRASGVLQAMNRAKTPEQAATIFEQGFEKAGIPALSHRTAAARRFFATGTAGGSSTPSSAPAVGSPAPVGTAVRASVRAANAKRGSRASRPLSAGAKAPTTAKDASQGTDQILSLLGFGNLSSTQPSPLSSFLGGPAPVRVAVGK